MVRLLPGHRLDPKLQHQRFEVAEPGHAFFDNVDSPAKNTLISTTSLDVLAALPFLPFCPA
jgi:hypothetical protein